MKWIFLSAVLILFMDCKLSEMKNAPIENDEVLKLYNKEMGFSIRFTNELCITRPSGLNGVVSVGTFARDLGCIDQRIIVDNRIGTLEKMTPLGLSINSWDITEETKNVLLAWTEKIVLLNESPIRQANNHFLSTDTPTFTAPMVSKVNDFWNVEVWVKEPGGFLPGATFSLAKVQYSNQGKLMGVLKVNQFAVSLN